MTPHAKAAIPREAGRTALLVSPFQDDHETLKELFNEEGWCLHSSSSLGMAFAFLRAQPVAVVMTERDLPLGDWKNVLEAINFLPDSPLLIVFSQLADEYLWSEALNRGAYDVLAKPLDRLEVVRVLNSAWNRYQQTSERHPKPVITTSVRQSGKLKSFTA
jgi:DNA-binding NtrC family response regulator